MYGLLRDQGSLFVQVRQHYSAVSPLLSTVLPAFKQKIRPAPEFCPHKNRPASEFFPTEWPKKTRSLPEVLGENGLTAWPGFRPLAADFSLPSGRTAGKVSCSGALPPCAPCASRPAARREAATPCRPGGPLLLKFAKFQGRSPPSKGLSGSSSFLRRSLLAQITREMTTRPLSSST